MLKRIKTKWVKALRSGKYAQTRGELRNAEGYCCLGVLTDLYCKEKNIRWKTATKSTTIALPKVVQEWANIRRSNPIIGKNTASQLNDGKMKSFEEIADLIDLHL